MAITYVSSGSGVGDDNTLTISSYTASSGTDRALIVGICYKVAVPAGASSVTWDSAGVNESFSEFADAPDGTNDAQVSLWYLTGHTAKTADISIFMVQGVRAVVFVMEFDGVDQTTPINATYATANGTDNSPTVTVSSAATDVIVGVHAQVSAGPDTVSSTTGTLRVNNASTGGGTDTRGTGITSAGTGSNVTVGHTLSSSDDWNIMAVRLQAAGAVSGWAGGDVNGIATSGFSEVNNIALANFTELNNVS